VGIIWIGSGTFGIDDPEVDVDVRLVIDKNQKSQPMEQFKIQNVKVEVDEMSWEWLVGNNQPDSDQFWIREKAIILYDPEKRLSKKFRQLRRLINKDYRINLWQSYKDLFVDYEVEKCIKRGEKEAGTLYLNQGINSLLKFLYIYKNLPVPPLKWRWYFLGQINIFDKDFKKLISRLLLSRLELTEKLQLYKQAEVKTQQLMIGAGYDPNKVEEYWRY